MPARQHARTRGGRPGQLDRMSWTYDPVKSRNTTVPGSALRMSVSAGQTHRMPAAYAEADDQPEQAAAAAHRRNQRGP